MVVKKAESEKWRSKISCICECGNECIKDYYYVFKGITKSCGCLYKENLDKLSFKAKGYGEISGTYMDKIKQNAKRREVLINIEYLWNLFLSQNRKCALSGLDLYFSTWKNNSSQTASLDRIDSKIGYVKGNVQWIHKHINNMKQDYDNDYFISMCELISKINKNELTGI